MSGPFSYPNSKHERKHGPTGYKTYESYRDWLRDEFSFRCAYCLGREKWSYILGVWELDHSLPQVSHASKILDYDNLIYSCRSCNGLKGKRRLPNPCEFNFGAALHVDHNGVITHLSKEGKALIQILRLDNKERTLHRKKLIDTFEHLKIHNVQLYNDWMGYPHNLPNLKKCRPAKNSKPDGVKTCFFELKKAGQLPDTY